MHACSTHVYCTCEYILWMCKTSDGLYTGYSKLVSNAVIVAQQQALVCGLVVLHNYSVTIVT